MLLRRFVEIFIRIVVIKFKIFLNLSQNKFRMTILCSDDSINIHTKALRNPRKKRRLKMSRGKINAR